MELFDAYMEVLKENPIVKIKLAVIKNESDLDIWKPELYPKIGERYYVSILKGNLRRRIKYALDSLQGQGIVRWKEITRIVPDICTETDEGTEERPETQSETDERIAECIEQIREQIPVWMQNWLYLCCCQSTQKKSVGITETSKSDMGVYSHLQRMKDRSRH